jgi:hypothetical protein
MASLVDQMVKKKLADHSKATQKTALKEALKTAKKLFRRGHHRQTLSQTSIQ